MIPPEANSNLSDDDTNVTIVFIGPASGDAVHTSRRKERSELGDWLAEALRGAGAAKPYRTKAELDATKLDDLKKKIEQLEFNLKSSQDNVKSYINAVRERDMVIRSLRDRIAVQMNTINEVREQASNSRKKADTFYAEKCAHERAISGLRKSISDLLEKLAAQGANVIELERKVAGYEASKTVEGTVDHALSLAARIDTLTADNGMLKANLAQAETTNKETCAVVTKLSNAIVNATQTLMDVTK